MAKNSGVKTASKVPEPKQSGVVRQTKEWASAVARIEAGERLEIRLPEKLNGTLRSPINAFVAALKRKYRRTYQIYAREGVIYALPKER
jgi:hypothetical protein